MRDGTNERNKLKSLTVTSLFFFVFYPFLLLFKMSAKDEQVQQQDSYEAFENYDFDNDEQFQVKEFPHFMFSMNFKRF